MSLIRKTLLVSHLWMIWSVGDWTFFCGRYGLTCADMVVADMVIGRYRCLSNWRNSRFHFCIAKI